jgi:adenylate cyclase
MGRSAPDRHLAAILTADVVGYSRLMGQDEIGTIRAVKTLLKRLIEPSVASHRGHIVKTMGDGLLAEFPSAVEAVSCALIIQQRTAREAAGSPKTSASSCALGSISAI